MIENRVLYYFLTVAEMRSFAEASRKLGINSSTLIRQIQGLEKELNVILFKRTKTAVLLTDDGNRLMPYALRTTGINSDIENEFFPDPDNIKGLVSIGFSDTLAFIALKEILFSFRTRYPGISIELEDLPQEGLKGGLDRSEIPFAVISDHGTDISRYTVIKELEEHKWGALMPSGLPLIENNYVCPGDILKYPLIIPSRIEERTMITNWISEEGVPESFTFTSDVYKMVPLVRQGLGIGFIPMDYSVDFSDVSVRLLYPPLKSSPRVLVRNGYLTSTEYRFRDHITSFGISG